MPPDPNLTNLVQVQDTSDALAGVIIVPIAMVDMAVIQTVGGAAAVGAACGGDGPVALATCAPAVGVIVPTVGAADLILLKGAYKFTVDETIPTWKDFLSH